MAKMNKAKFVTGNDMDLGRISVGLEFHKTIDYDRKPMRKALNKGAADVRKEARRLVSRMAISAPGENPGVVTGRLKRAIGTVTKGTLGGWVKIGVRTIKGSLFYPAMLFYGSKKRNIAKRNNFMVEALQNKRETIRSEIRAVLKDSLIPR